MAETPPSNRQRKKFLAAEVEKLRSKPGWDPAKHVSTTPSEALAELGQRAATDKAYGARCEACAKARADGGDADALCEAHLAQAMGF